MASSYGGPEYNPSQGGQGPQGPGYSGPGGPGYPSSGGPGYPSSGEPAYPSSGGPGYPSSGGPGYGTPGGTGYGAPTGPAYDSPGGSGPGGPGYGGPGYGGPGYGGPGYEDAPAPQQGTNGLAIAGLILAFLMWPIGLILSIVALVQTRRRNQKGRGLAIGGIVVSVLAGVLSIVLIVAAFATVKNIDTIADPGCTSGKAAVLKLDNLPSNDVPKMKAQLQQAVADLNTASAKAKDARVRDAMKTMAGDITQLLQGLDSGNMPAGMEDKMTRDGSKIDELCTIGGSGK